MKRRDFITLIGSAAAAWPLVARAQQPDRLRRIGVMMAQAEGDPEGRARAMALQESLEKLRWTIGRDVRIDYRWGVDPDGLRAAVVDLLALAPDVILAGTSTMLVTLKRAAPTVPVVFVMITEPVAQGFVQGLAHPGGSITGFTNLEATAGAKWLELLKETAPQVKRVAFMITSDNPAPMQYSGAAEAAGRNLGVTVTTARVHGPAEIDAAMATLGREPGGGLILPPDGYTLTNRTLIVELAARHRLPAIYGIRDFAAEGGLVFFGVDVKDQYRQAAGYIDRILRGEKPGDLPVQQPTKFEFVINLKTAKALGLEVPLLLQQRADEVIE